MGRGEEVDMARHVSPDRPTDNICSAEFAPPHYYDVSTSERLKRRSNVRRKPRLAVFPQGTRGMGKEGREANWDIAAVESESLLPLSRH